MTEASLKGKLRSPLVLAGVVATVFVIALALVLVLSGSGSSEEGGSATGGSGYPNADLANTRSLPSSIDGSNVGDLEVAWEQPIEAPETPFGRSYSTPVVADGIVYSQDQEADVRAIDLESGEVIWERRFGTPIPGPGGVAVGEGHIYGATAEKVFALDPESGEEIWSTPLPRKPSEGIAMAPGFHHGLVYASTTPMLLEGGEQGVLWALDAKTGRKVWSFDTVPAGLWGRPDLNFGGGVGYTPAFDDRGSMYVSIGIPGPAPGTETLPWGASRPGPNLYTNSVVKLDAKTGRIQWHYQLTPHGLCNTILASPVLLRAGGRDLVVTAGRAGIVVALDQATGKVAWKRPVGTHNGHDNDGLIAMRGEYSKLKLPMVVLPGREGGVSGPFATDGSTIYLPVVDRAIKLSGQLEAADSLSSEGEIVALDAATGAVRWQHEMTAPPLGAPVISNDLVFVTSADGTAYALNKKSGGEAWVASLPSETNSGLAITDDTLLVPAAYGGDGSQSELLAYRLP